MQCQDFYEDRLCLALWWNEDYDSAEPRTNSWRRFCRWEGNFSRFCQMTAQLVRLGFVVVTRYNSASFLANELLLVEWMSWPGELTFCFYFKLWAHVRSILVIKHHPLVVSFWRFENDLSVEESIFVLRELCWDFIEKCNRWHWMRRRIQACRKYWSWELVKIMWGSAWCLLSFLAFYDNW